jgi:hypothetical protein
MDPVYHQLISTFQQLSGDDDDRGCAIADFLVLQVR